MNKVKLFIVLVLMFWACAAIAGERAANAYKTTKLTTTSVLISCNDEREPQVSRLDASATAIVVTCR